MVAERLAITEGICQTAEQAFSFSEYCKIASRDEEDFADFGTVITQGDRRDWGSTYTFKDNDSPVLAVAHLDTVQPGTHSSIIYVKGERVLLCPRLDDRLGVYVITRMLPRLGINCDVLLTTGEEVGCSSAEHFIAGKEYGWCFSFDRSGADVVLYQHDYKALRRVMRKSGFRVGQGSFSDISSLDIGCSGINFGVGYYDPHGLHAYAKLSETFRMVNKFVTFYRKHHDKVLPFNRDSRWQTMSSYSRRGWYSSSNSRERYYTGYSGAGYQQCSRDGYTSYGYPEYESMWSKDSKGRWVKNEYLDFYDIEANQDAQSGDEIIENLADRAQTEDNGK